MRMIKESLGLIGYPEEAIDYDLNPPYEISQELVDEYTRIMLEYYNMQNKLRAIRGE